MRMKSASDLVNELEEYHNNCNDKKMKKITSVSLKLISIGQNNNIKEQEDLVKFLYKFFWDSFYVAPEYLNKKFYDYTTIYIEHNISNDKMRCDMLSLFIKKNNQ